MLSATFSDGVPTANITSPLKQLLPGPRLKITTDPTRVYYPTPPRPTSLHPPKPGLTGSLSGSSSNWFWMLAGLGLLGGYLYAKNNKPR